MFVPLAVSPLVGPQYGRTHGGPMKNEWCKMILPKTKSFCHIPPTYLPAIPTQGIQIRSIIAIIGKIYSYRY